MVSCDLMIRADRARYTVSVEYRRMSPFSSNHVYTYVMSRVPYRLPVYTQYRSIRDIVTCTVVRDRSAEECRGGGCGEWGCRAVPSAGVDYLVMYLVTTDAPPPIHVYAYLPE